MSFQKLRSELEESVGDFIKYWGFKKIHGQVWCYIYLEKNEVSSRQIKERFDISKALLSQVVNDLKDYDVIFEAGHGDNGAQLFIANEHVFDCIRKVLVNRELKMLKKVHQIVTKLSKYDDDNKRIKKLSRLTNISVNVIDKIIVLDRISLTGLKKFVNLKS